MPVLPMVTVSAALNFCDSAGSASVRGVVNELPAPHNSLLGEGLGPDTTCFGRIAPRVGYGFFCAR